MILKKRKYYIRLYLNRIEIKDLKTGKTVSENSQTEFNNSRILIAQFNEAEFFFKSVFRKHDLNTRNSIGIIQQVEMSEGGLSEVEKRILLEIFERVGIKTVYLKKGTTRLSEKQLNTYK